jgi:hypothetical protein
MKPEYSPCTALLVVKAEQSQALVSVMVSWVESKDLGVSVVSGERQNEGACHRCRQDPSS